MSYFKKIHIFFTTNQDIHSSTSKSILPLFPNSFAEEQARPPFMVYQRRPIVPLILLQSLQGPLRIILWLLIQHFN